jgi:hypothetical protein
LPARPEQPKGLGVEQARREMLEKKETFFSRPPSRWELMFPPLMMYKMGLKHLMQNPKFVEWLSKEGAEPTKGGGPSANEMFEKLFGKEYKEAGDLAEWETGSREGGKATGGWTTPVP